MTVPLSQAMIQTRKIEALKGEIERLQQWVNDLQAGMYINCVYCGHRYGPDDEVPATMAQVLKDHIEQCPKHPMSALKADVKALVEVLRLIADFAPGNGDECEFIARKARAALARLDVVEAREERTR